MNESGDSRREMVLRYGFPLSLAVLTVLAARSMAAGFAPDSLWLDDLWVVVLADQGSLSEIFGFHAPISPLFLLLLKGAGSVLPVGDLAWQLLPFLATVASIPLVGLIGARVADSRITGIACAALYAASPVLMTYGVRVKSFGLDALAIAVLLLLSVDEKVPDRFVYVAAIVLAPLSFTSVFLSLPLCTALALRNRTRGDALHWVALAAAMVATYAFLIAGRANAVLHNFWHDHYIPLEPDRFVATAPVIVRDLLTSAFPDHFEFLALLAIPGIWALFRRKPVTGVGVSGMYGLLLIASLAQRYPLGTGRTEIFTFPAITLLVVLGAMTLVRQKRPAKIGWATVFVLLFLWSTAFRNVDYVETHAREVVQLANEHVTDRDAMVVYPLSTWALAHYGRWPVDLVATDQVANGYVAIPQRERTLVLDARADERDFTEHPPVLEEPLGDFLDQGFERVWLVATSAEPAPNQWIVDTFLRSGYVVTRATRLKGAGFALFEKADPGG